MSAAATVRRGPIEGFIAPDDEHTHGIKVALVGYLSSWCGRGYGTWANGGARRSGRFIANAKHPLCYGCVSAIEDDLRSRA